MSNEDWLISNEKSHYESLKKQDISNKKLIKELQTELITLKQALNIPPVIETSSFEKLKRELNDIKDFSDKNYKEDSKHGVNLVHLQMMNFINDEQEKHSR